MSSIKYKSEQLFLEYRSYRSIANRNKLVLLHRGLAGRAACRYRNTFVAYEDLYQVGMLGLIKAVERYDRSKNDSFASFASLLINGEILHYLRDKKPLIKPTRSVHELFHRGLSWSKEHFRGSESDRDRSIANYLNISEKKWHECRVENEMTFSLDKPVYDGEKASLFFSDTIADSSSNSMWSKVEIDLALSTLEGRTKIITKLYFLEDLEKKDISRRLNINPNTVTRHLTKAISQLKQRQCQA